MADQLDPDAEVAGIVAVACVVLELLGALLEEPGQLLPQRRRRKRPLHLPHAPSEQGAGGGSIDRSTKEMMRAGSGRKGWEGRRRTGAMGGGGRSRSSSGCHPPPTRGAPSPALRLRRPFVPIRFVEDFSGGRPDKTSISNFISRPTRPLKGNGHGKARAHLSVILYCPAHLPDLHGALSSHSIASAVYLHPITTQRPCLLPKKFYTVSVTSNLRTYA